MGPSTSHDQIVPLLGQGWALRSMHLLRDHLTVSYGADDENLGSHSPPTDHAQWKLKIPPSQAPDSARDARPRAPVDTSPRSPADISQRSIRLSAGEK